MAGKDVARQVIDALPDEASVDEIIHALYLHAKFQRGESEIRQGRGLTNDQAKQRLGKWVK